MLRVLLRTDLSIWQKVRYEILAEVLDHPLFLFMNHGTSPTKDNHGLFDRFPEFSMWKASVELYEQVTADIEIKGKAILELGCGRGGGIFSLANLHEPRIALGLDRCCSNIQAAKTPSIQNKVAFAIS